MTLHGQPADHVNAYGYNGNGLCDEQACRWITMAWKRRSRCSVPVSGGSVCRSLHPARQKVDFSATLERAQVSQPLGFDTQNMGDFGEEAYIRSSAISLRSMIIVVIFRGLQATFDRLYAYLVASLEEK